MGYYTNYELKVISGEDPKTDYEKAVIEKINYSPFCSEVKWYSFEKDMREFSKQHPNVLFELSGEGERNGDLWKAYFKNGKMQMCKARIEFDNFDETQLK